MDGLFNGNAYQLWAQLVSVIGTWAFVYVVSRIILKVTDALLGLRVSHISGDGGENHAV